MKHPKKYRIGNERLTVKQIARRAKTTMWGIRLRMRKGITGKELLKAQPMGRPWGWRKLKSRPNPYKHYVSLNLQK